jgi:hypothetical protein
MDDHDNRQYHVAWILTSFDRHEIVTQFFDVAFDLTPYTSTSSEIAYTRGKVGPHNVVVASTNHNSTSQRSSRDIAESLLEAFPYIRAGFLVSDNATVPRDGDAKVGDVVLGIGSEKRAGVVHFDHQETTKRNRLFMTSESRHIPGTIVMALKDFRSPDGYNEWLRCLDQHAVLRPSRPAARQAGDERGDHIHESFSRRQPRSFTGSIASSEQPLNDPVLMKDIAAGNGVLCFETAAASMRSRPFVVVAGIAHYSGDDQEKLPSHEVCKIVASYICCFIRSIRPIPPTILANEHPIKDYFEYEPFDLARPGFRLLRLEGGTGEIKCHVFQAYLDDQDLIPYEALSYCWGSNRLINEIKANGKVMFVTDSLFEALQQLRGVDEDRIFWIDAICIDQSNIQERGHQVERMGQIYSCADRVRIWLGRIFEPGIRRLMAALQSFDASVPQEAWGTWPYDDPRWSDVWEAQAHPPHEQNYDDLSWSDVWEAQADSPQEQSRDEINQQSGLKLLMRQQWFRRVWILQEVANAKTASVECSQGSTNARSFALAPRLLGVVPDIQCQAIMDMMPGPSRRSSRWLKNQNLCTLMWRFRESEATDPRDKLYALLGLVSDDDSMGKITADYTKNEDGIVKDIAAYLFGEGMFDVRDIADLQRKIPNLSCIVLERLILGGARVKDIQEFMQRQNATFWLSERTIAYAHCFSKSVMDYLSTEAAFEYVAGCPVLEEPILEGRETVKSFLGEGKQAKVTQDTIELARNKGIDLLMFVIDQNRYDIEITEPLIMQAVRTGPHMLKLLLDKRGKDTEVAEVIVLEAIRRGTSMLKLLLDKRGKGIPITEAIVLEAIQSGTNMLKLLLDKRGKDVLITEPLLMQTARTGPFDLFELLFDNCWKDIPITEPRLMQAVRTDPNMLKVLLDRRGEGIQITEAIVLAAIEEGTLPLRVLLARPMEEVKITRAIVEAAVCKRDGVPGLLWEMREYEMREILGLQSPGSQVRNMLGGWIQYWSGFLW